MINIIDKTKCCGCSACFNICPKNAVSMEYDSEGFLYPKVDNDKCIKCGLCLKVCPIINTLQSNLLADELIAEKLRMTEKNKHENYSATLFSTQADKQIIKNKVLEVYGAKNKNVDEQLKSSSGGMFSIFANYVLEQNGIVFGASFDKDWKVVHKYIDKKENLDDLRRSKYVQSDINITYKQAKQFLEEKKLVLFTGTPCQIAGLKSYLQKDYENLIAIDFICHGTPSPKVWKNFLNENFNKKNIKEINFRNKEFGWISFFDNYFLTNARYKNFKKFFINIIKVNKIQHLLISNYLYSTYFKGFLKNLFLRPICYQCIFKNNINSDFTIADFWGINKVLPKMYDKNGVSVLIINSEKAKILFDKLKENMEYTKINNDYMLNFNKPFLSSVKTHPNREEFFARYKNEKLNKLILELLNEKPLIIKIFKKIIKKINRQRTAK